MFVFTCAYRHYAVAICVITLFDSMLYGYVKSKYLPFSLFKRIVCVGCVDFEIFRLILNISVLFSRRSFCMILILNLIWILLKIALLFYGFNFLRLFSRLIPITFLYSTVYKNPINRSDNFSKRTLQFGVSNSSGSVNRRKFAQNIPYYWD